MTTQIQQQQVQGLVGSLSNLDAAYGSLSGVYANLTFDLDATGYSLQQITIDNAANLNATGVTLNAAIVRNTNLINATGNYFAFLFDALSPQSVSTVSGAARYANYSLASDFRLNDYVLQTSLTGLPTGTVCEASSVCYNPSGCNYLVLSPRPYTSPAIKEFEFGGTGLVRSTYYDWPAGYKDVEGITHVLGNQFALCSEFGPSSKNAILLFDYIGNTNLGGTIPDSDFTVYDVGNPYSPAEPTNIGLEGISYNPQTQVFYGAIEGNDTYDWKVLEIKLGLAPATTTGELFSKSTVTFSPTLERLSDLYYDPNSRHLFLTDHGDTSMSPGPPATRADRSRVFECDLEGNLIDYVDLKCSDGTNYNQLEGITFSPDGGRMVIAGEAGDQLGSDLGFYTTSSFAASGAYLIPAVLTVSGVVDSDRHIAEADNGTYVHCAGNTTLTLPAPTCSGQFDGFQCEVFNEGVGTVSILPDTVGASFKAKGEDLAAKNWAKIWCLSGIWFGAGDLA